MIVVDRLTDLPTAVAGYPAMTAKDYIMQPRATRRTVPKILNLSRSYGYQTLGYYCSLLAEARGHKVVPTVTTVLELTRRTSYVYALAELEDTLNRTIRRLADPPTASFRLLVCLGQVDDARFARSAGSCSTGSAARSSRCSSRPARAGVRKLAPLAITELGDAGKAQLGTAIQAHVSQPWKSPRAKALPRFTLGVLLDPRRRCPLPTSPRSAISSASPRAGLGVEVIGKKDFDRIAEFDALWIRENTNIDHHTFRFAKRAEQEGLPVIDDPNSIIRCTNKVYLAELLNGNGVATPKTVIISSVKDLDALQAQLSYPMVLKIPDGSFSRGAKVGDRAELERMVRGMLEDSDLILAQEFMYTAYDWRLGVLDGELFVSRT